MSNIRKAQKKFDLDKALDSIDLSFNGYVPSEDALEFFALMRLVQGEDFEFSTPLFHYWLVDLMFGNITRDHYPYSKEVRDTITINAKRICIVASRGVAKALPLTNIIKTPNGDLTIADSAIGDSVYDRDGKVCRIVGKSEVFHKQMYRMTMADGRTLDMSADHDNIIWKRQRGRTVGENRCNTYSPSGWKEVVLTAEEIYNAGATTHRDPTLKNPKGRDTKFQLPNSGISAEFAPNPFPIDEYTTGVILGDGSTDSSGYTRITVHVDDLYNYEMNIPYVFGTHTYAKDADGNLLNSLMFGLLQMSSKIKKYIGTENSYTKRVPKAIMTGSRLQRLEVLRGLMDTDGTVGPNGSTSFTSTSKGLAEDVLDIVRALGGSGRIVEQSTPSPFGKAWRVHISINEDIFKLERKRARQQFRSDKYSVAIESIEKIDMVPTQCIAVSSPTKSFITNDWTVTHNSTVVTAFYPVYCAIKGKTPDGIKSEFHLLVAASQQGGGRVMAKAVQSLCEDSVFCQNYFESMRFTETESEFIRKGNTKVKNRVFLARYIGIGGGIRGVRSNIGSERPDHIIFDDVILNSDTAYSDTIMNSLRTTIKADAINALRGGGRGKIFSVATPFHLLDPVIEMLTGGAYTPVAIPICEKIYEGMPEEEFVGVWPSMHPYEAVIEQYESAVASNATREFNQERMLRISSDEDRMISDNMIEWYSRKDLLKNIGAYNIYITTDFTTTSEAKSDFSALAAWAVNSNRDYYLVDLCVKRQGIAEQYNELFRMVNFWLSHGRSVEVGIEVDGQQKAHLFALKEMMLKRSEWFTFARQKGTKIGSQGILSRNSGGNKHERFRMMLPQFQNHKIHFPYELENTPDMREALTQLKYTTWEAFGGHDDFCFIAGTRIKLADGTTRSIEDISIEEVQTFDSDVLTSQAYPATLTGTKEVFKYTLSDGYSFEATPNHPVLTKEGWKKLEDVTSNDYLIKDIRAKSVEASLNGTDKKTHALKNVIASMLLRIKKLLTTYAGNVERSLQETESSNLEESSVLKIVQKSTTTEYVKLVSNEFAGVKDVYNFEVKKTHNYILENGLVVHNCDTISQLGMIELIFPMVSPGSYSADSRKDRSLWDDIEDTSDSSAYSSYT